MSLASARPEGLQPQGWVGKGEAYLQAPDRHRNTAACEELCASCLFWRGLLCRCWGRIGRSGYRFENHPVPAAGVGAMQVGDTVAVCRQDKYGPGTFGLALIRGHGDTSLMRFVPEVYQVPSV